jgi:vancomycin resistance protein YoaR
MPGARDPKKLTGRKPGAGPGARYGSGGERRRGGRNVAFFALAACAVVALLVAADYRLNAGKIYDGVRVGEISLGGETPEEARATLRERTAGPLEEFDFIGPQRITYAAGELGVGYDVAATVEKAYAVGRTGGVLERLSGRVRAATGTVTVPPETDYRPEVARERVRELAAALNREPEEASVSVSGSKVRVTPSRAGYRLDLPATVRNAERAVEAMTSEVEVTGEARGPRITTREAEEAAREAREALDGGLVFEAAGQRWTLSPVEVGAVLGFSENDEKLRAVLDRDRLRDRLTDMYAGLTVESVEAGYEIEGDEVSVTGGRPGMRVEDRKLLDTVEAGIFEGKREYAMPVVSVEPELTTEEAEALKPTELLGRYRTNYTISGDDSPERVENLEIASTAISGTMLAPGEVFSANEILAPLDYNEAKVIVDGKVDYADGGGLCQIASTLYMAVNYAGLDVTERHPHYAELPYIRPGFDATVWFGSLDMKFRNNSSGYVLVREYVADDGYVYAEVYGKPTGREVEMRSRKVSAGDDSTSWITYQTMEQGEETLFDGVLHRDTYEPLMSEEGELLPNARPAPVRP